MIDGLHHIAILASNKSNTLSFYKSLGFSLTESHLRPQRQDEILFMHQSGITLEIFISSNHPERPSRPEAYGLRHLALKTGNAQSVREMLIQKGYAPQPLRIDSFSGKNMFFILDPDGLPVEIHE